MAGLLETFGILLKKGGSFAPFTRRDYMFNLKLFAIMKKIAYFLSLVLLFTSFAPAAMAKGDEPSSEKESLSAEEQARVEQLDARMAEIKAMDFKSMDKEERKEVRKELREINKEAKDLGGGIYISAGALIVVLLLLLILT